MFGELVPKPSSSTTLVNLHGHSVNETLKINISLSIGLRSVLSSIPIDSMARF